jgi:hypothetical protein
VSEIEILTAAGLPKVNRSVYHHGSVIVPYMVCREKHLKQTGSVLVWDVEASFDSEGQEEEEPVEPPVSPANLNPKVERSIETLARVMYKDKTGRAIATPTGNPFSEPAIEQVPILVLTVTQYEQNISDAVLLARSLVMNKDTFRGRPKHTWMIFSMTADDAEIPLANGSMSAGWFRTQYTLKYRVDKWTEARALIDTHYLDGLVKLQFLDGGQPTTGWLKLNGTIQPKASGLIFDEFETQGESSWPFLAGINN